MEKAGIKATWPALVTVDLELGLYLGRAKLEDVKGEGERDRLVAAGGTKASSGSRYTRNSRREHTYAHHLALDATVVA